jgi:hypothetical protein
MAIKSTGALSFATDIVGEFADSAPHSMSEFYGGGDKVPAGANPGVATSGTINFNSFYDCVAATVLTISSNTNDYNIGAACIAAGGDKATPVILTINAGVTVGSTANTIPAMKTDTGWSSGVSITITNNGTIVGSTGSNVTSGGGSGGSGGKGKGYNSSWGPCTSGGPGTSGSSGSTGSGSADSASNGGDAFEHSQTADNYLSVIFDTAGTRTGGSGGTTTIPGGGGGGGGGGYGPGVFPGIYQGGGGGGGGAMSGSYGQGGANMNCGDGGCSCSGKQPNGSGGGSSGGGGGPRAGSGGSVGNSGGGGSNGGYGGGGAGSTGYASGSAGSALAGNTGQIS